jgi:translation elongation factor P/translation initiation factor 5A
MAETINTNQFKNGMCIELDGVVWKIIEFQHVKPGKGGAFVRTKLKALESGAVVDKTFRAGEKFSRVHTEVKNVQYLYDAGDDVVFMDEENYEQLHLTRGSVEPSSISLSPDKGSRRRGRRKCRFPPTTSASATRSDSFACANCVVRWTTRSSSSCLASAASRSTVSRSRGAATAKAKEMQQMAGGTWDKLEQVFEDRVQRGQDFIST